MRHTHSHRTSLVRGGVDDGIGGGGCCITPSFLLLAPLQWFRFKVRTSESPMQKEAAKNFQEPPPAPRKDGSLIDCCGGGFDNG